MDIYEKLDSLGIEYKEVSHKAVYTSERAMFIKSSIEGTGCKNLFLTDKNDRYFICIIEDTQKADLKRLAKTIGVKHLTFANEDKLFSFLGLIPGSVTPLGIVNDTENKVEILIDKNLEGKKLLFHPLTNTKTLSIKWEDLFKLVKNENHTITVF